MRLINCPNCGHRCSDKITYCPDCGFQLNTFFSSNTKKRKLRWSKILATAGLCMVGIIIVCLSLFFFSRRLKQPSDPIDSIESSTPIQIEETAELAEQNTSNDHMSDEPVSVNETKDTTNTTAPSIDEPDAVSSDLSPSESVSGVYSGDDHEILVLNSDGLAYYYCVSIEFTELQCPWYIKEDQVYVELARLHCTIYADISDKELIFKSDSLNWNPEVFTRINVSPDDYLTRALSTHDPNAVLNYDGTISYTMARITYTIPKSYVDYEDEFDYDDYSSAFIESDPQTDYSSTILFYNDIDGTISTTSELSSVKTFTSGFYDNVSVTLSSESTVDGNPARIYDFTGYLNEGFMNLRNTAMSGYVVVFQNKINGKANVIMFTQTSSRSFDNSEAFLEMIKAAQ